MLLINDELSELSFDEALDRIAALPSLEEQAQLLTLHSHLCKTRRGAAQMRKVAASITPFRQHLFDVLQSGREERSRKIATAEMKKAKAAEAAANRAIMPSLFDQF